MKKLLIARADVAFSNDLANYFQEQCEVRTCTDGESTLELLDCFTPNVLALNLMLPQIDGIAILEELRKRKCNPCVLVLSSFLSPYILGRLQRLGVDYVMEKPSKSDIVKARIQDFLDQTSEDIVADMIPQTMLTSMLLQMGFSPKLSGFHFLLEAIPMYAENPKLSITKELYTALNGKDGRLAERSIRSAIEKAWETGNHVQWFQLFGTETRPSNGCFIARMAQVLKDSQNGQAMA